MIRTRTLLTAAIVSFVATSAFADVNWDAVKSKAQGAKDYHVVYKYEGRKGKLTFDYGCVIAPGNTKIRTEIKDSSDASKKGTILIFDEKKQPGKVKAQTPSGPILRNITHEDVKDTPFYQPIYGWIVSQVSGTPTKAKDGDKTRFDFKTGGGGYKIWANDAGEIVKTERTEGHDKETREFSDIKFNCNPKTDL